MLYLYWNLKLSAKKGTWDSMQRGWIVLLVCLSVPADCGGSSYSSHQWVLWKQLYLMLPLPGHECLSSTHLSGMAWHGFCARSEAGFEPFWQGTGRACMCVCAAQLDSVLVCPVAGVAVLISPPVGSALHIMWLLQSPSRRGNTSRAVHDLLKYTFMKALSAKVRWSQEASIF